MHKQVSAACECAWALAWGGRNTWEGCACALRAQDALRRVGMGRGEHVRGAVRLQQTEA